MFTELDDKQFVYTFVLILEKFLHEKFSSGAGAKTDFIKDTTFIRESLNVLGTQLCTIASGSLKTSSEGVVPTRLCVSTLDLILTVSTAFCTNMNNSMVVESDDELATENLRKVCHLFCFVAKIQEKIFMNIKPLYAAGLSKAVQVAEAQLKDISRIGPLLAQHMNLSGKVSTNSDITLEVQRIIGFFGNPSRKVLGLVCLCLLLGRSPSKSKKDIECMVLTQVKELITADCELGIKVIKTFLPLDNIVEEETVVIKPLLSILNEGFGEEPALNLVGELATRHQEEVVTSLFTMIQSDNPATREIGIRTLKLVINKAKSDKVLSTLIVDYTLENIQFLARELDVSDILVTLGDPAYTLTRLVHYLENTSRSDIEAVIVSFMEKSVSELETDESVCTVIRSYADAMRTKKLQSTFTISSGMSPADLCKLHATGKEDFSDELLRLVPRWCHGLYGSAILAATEKVLSAPGDTALVQFFKSLAPHFQKEDVELLFIPFVTMKLEFQRRLTEEMLDSPYGKEQVTALIFERVSPLLALKIVLGYNTVSISDPSIRKRLEDALVERITSLLEFDEVRRVAAEVTAFLRPQEHIFEKLYNSLITLSEPVMAASNRNDDIQIVLRAVVYALGSIIKDLDDSDDIPSKYSRLEEITMNLVEKKMRILAPALIGTAYDLLGVLLFKSKDFNQRVEKMLDEILCEKPKSSERNIMLTAVLTSVAKDLNESNARGFVQLVVPRTIEKIFSIPNDYLINVNNIYNLFYFIFTNKLLYFIYSFCL